MEFPDLGPEFEPYISVGQRAGKFSESLCDLAKLYAQQHFS